MSIKDGVVKGEMPGLNNENAELINIKKGLDDQIDKLNKSIFKYRNSIDQMSIDNGALNNKVAEITAELCRSRSVFKTALAIMLIEAIILVICMII